MVEQLSVPHQHTPSLQEVVQGLDDTQLAASLRGIDDDQVQRIVQCLHGLNNYGNQRLEQSGMVIFLFYHLSLFGNDLF
jgi:hypothetical protein